jgi:hypothetical protein
VRAAQAVEHRQRRVPLRAARRLAHRDGDDPRRPPPSRPRARSAGDSRARRGSG